MIPTAFVSHFAIRPILYSAVGLYPKDRAEPPKPWLPLSVVTQNVAQVNRMLGREKEESDV